MMKRTLRSLGHSVTQSLAGVVVLTLGLSSCGNSLQSKQLFPQAQPITAVATEALALTQAIRSGLRVQSAQTLELNHLYTQDILGNLYGDIIFSTPETVPNALEYAVGIKDQDWSNVDDPTYQTVVMGASTARSILLYRANHQRLIGNIGKTIQALGGVGQVQKLVSVNGVDSIWILDKQNAYWAVSTGQPVAVNQVSEAISSATKTTAEINAKSELVDVFKKQWSVILEGQTTSPGAGGQKVSDKLDPLKGENPLVYFDNGKGRLNKKLFLEMAQLSGAFSANNVQPQFNNGFSFCIWFFCVGYNSGGLPSSKLADLSGGFAQRLEHFANSNSTVASNYPTGQFNIPSFTFGLNSSYNIGCGPASFSGLAWWHWKNSTDAWGNKLTVNSVTHANTVARYTAFSDIPIQSDDIFYQRLLQPNSAGTPRIAELMRTGSVGSDTPLRNPSFTWPDNEVFGGSQWLQDQGMDLRMYGVVGYSSYFTFVAGAAIGSAFGPAAALVGATFGWTADVFIKIGLYTRMGQLIVQDVGQREIPLIAVYNVSGGGFDFNGLHYSPIREYSITNWLVWPDVQVKTVDTNEFRALSDISLPASGLMGAYQPSKEYAPSLWPGLISWR
jgi:hypothetical protein